MIVTEAGGDTFGFMKRTNKCPKCDSGDIIPDVMPLNSSDYGGLMVATNLKPDALLFKGWRSTGLSAWVCADCGYVEMYAKNPKQLRK